MGTVHGKTGASGLVHAAHSLADALAVKLVRGPQTTSCSTPAVADSSVQGGRLKLGPAKKQIVKRLKRLQHVNGVNGKEPAAPYLAESLAVRRARGERPTTCRTDSAAAFSALERKLKPGAAETPKLDFCFKIVMTSFGV